VKNSKIKFRMTYRVNSMCQFRKIPYLWGEKRVPEGRAVPLPKVG